MNETRFQIWIGVCLILLVTGSLLSVTLFETVIYTRVGHPVVTLPE